MLIVAAWGLVLLAVFSVTCNHMSGCLTCECLKDEPPSIEELYHQGMQNPYDDMETKINSMYGAMYEDSKGNRHPMYMHKDFYKRTIVGIEGESPKFIRLQAHKDKKMIVPGKADKGSSNKKN